MSLPANDHECNGVGTHHDQVVALTRCYVVGTVALRSEVYYCPAFDVLVLTTKLTVACCADAAAKCQARGFKVTTQADIERDVRVVCVPARAAKSFIQSYSGCQLQQFK